MFLDIRLCARPCTSSGSDIVTADVINLFIHAQRVRCAADPVFRCHWVGVQAHWAAHAAVCVCVSVNYCFSKCFYLGVFLVRLSRPPPLPPTRGFKMRDSKMYLSRPFASVVVGKTLRVTHLERAHCVRLTHHTRHHPCMLIILFCKSNIIELIHNIPSLCTCPRSCVDHATHRSHGDVVLEDRNLQVLHAAQRRAVRVGGGWSHFV